MEAAFLDPGYGARPAGMGNAFTAVSDDLNAILFNPAGATQAASRQAAVSHGRPFSGLDDANLNLNYFAALMPVRDMGTVEIAWANLVAPVYRQDTVSLLGAAPVNRWLPDGAPPVSVGVTGRYLRHRFDLDERTAGDSVFSRGHSRDGFTVDVGAQVEPDPRLLPGLTIGAAAKSLNQPDLGFAEKENVRREWDFGAALNRSHMTFSADLVDRAGALDWRVGAETWLRKETFGLRAGANPEAVSAGFSYLFRLKHAGLFWDYSFSVPIRVGDTSGSHRAALGLLF